MPEAPSLSACEAASDIHWTLPHRQKGQMQWRILELDALYSEEPQPNGKLPRPAVTLITFFQGNLGQTKILDLCES